ncbi:MAG: response regulator [Candidatus Omnitrophota bacterium]|nr:response regulator [Candidatus Omnitrophota bacterium]
MAKKVLLIDDDPNIVRFVSSRLKQSGYDVYTANDGKAGLDEARKVNPDLILVDVMMPEMDGYTFVRTLRREDNFKQVPIIVVTAKEKMQELFALEGIKEYVIKPFAAQDLLDKIKKWVDSSPQ